MKQSFIALISFFIFFSTFAFSQKNDGNVFKKGTDEYKMFMAKQDFFGGDYRSALNKYKEVEKNRPNDASVHFYIGECYYMMKDYEDAVTELEKAKSLNPLANSELPLILGKAYHVRGLLDKALEELNSYRRSIADNKNKIAETEIDVEIAQCEAAKKLIAKPVNIKIIQQVDLNSQYDDKKPVLTNNDKTLIITSRRPTGDKSKVDAEGDYGYKDDVYESFWNDEKRSWSSAEMIRGPINTDDYDACTSISFDGSMMFIYRNGGEARGGEIYLSKKSTSGKWKSPEILLKPINTSYFEDGACLSPDGLILYFVSERPGGKGRGGDIYMSKKVAEGWGEPLSLGDTVNSLYDEQNPVLTPDGKTLFFASDRSESMGFHDIFKTTRGEDGKWSIPVNVGYPINTVGLETKFIMTADKKTGFIATVRDSGIGEQDVYMIDLTYYDVFTGVSTQPAPKPAVLTGKISGTDTTGSVTTLVADIRILDKATGAQLAVTKSAANGTYSIEFAGNKPLTIEISSEGYQKSVADITVPVGKTESKDVTLTKNN